MTPLWLGAAFLAACAISAGMIAVARKAVSSAGLLDVPDGDPLKVHTRPTPRIGGVGIVLGAVTAAVGVGTTVPRGDLLLVLLPSVFVAGVGFRDDRGGLPPLLRLAAEMAASAGLVLIASRVGVIPAFFPTGLTSMLVAAVYLPGGVNAVNMQDGIDGLAGGLTFISCCGFATIGALERDGLVVLTALVLAGAIAGFLCFNAPPASVFMGDSGSYFVGFTLAALALLLSGRSGTVSGWFGALLILGVPVLDGGAAALRRVARGQSPFRGDRSHFYDILLRRGHSLPMVLASAYGVQLGVVLAGVWMLRG